MISMTSKYDREDERMLKCHDYLKTDRIEQNSSKVVRNLMGSYNDLNRITTACAEAFLDEPSQNNHLINFDREAEHARFLSSS